MALESSWKTSLFQLPLFRNPWPQLSNRLRFSSLSWYSGRRIRAQCLQTKEYKADPELQSTPTRSPYDLVLFRRSRFVAHLNELSRRRGDNVPPRDEQSALDGALKSAGNAHEERVVIFLENLLGTDAYRIPFAHGDRYKLTIDAIRRREPIIAGAALHDDTFAGYADLLILSSFDPYLPEAQKENLDPNAYVVCEIKLSSLSTVDFLLQTAAYASMLHDVHRELDIKHPAHSYLWLGPPENPPVRLDYRDLKHFFRRTKSDFLTFTRNFEECAPLPEPDAPVQMLSPWKSFATETLRTADSLQMIAGIRRSQVDKIRSRCGVSTLREFARIPPGELSNIVNRGELSPAYLRLQQQASVQYESRVSGSICYRKIYEHGQSMPEPSENDMFFDMEGYPLIENGLEYLFGVSTRKNGSFKAWWAHTREEEEQAFIELLQWIRVRVEEQSKYESVRPHVFHYGHYEASALRRIAMRVKTVQGVEGGVLLESFLESGVFVDVFKFVKSELLIGDPSYSIKSVEKIVGVIREDHELADAQSSVAMYHEWRMKHFSVGHHILRSVDCHPTLQEIYEYNKQDCESLVLVVDWLTKEFLPKASKDLDIVNPKDDESDLSSSLILPGSCGRTLIQRQEDSKTIQRSEKLSHLLIHEKSDFLDLTAWKTLYHLLGFYVRESSPVRRAFRDRIEAAASGRWSELHDDDKCITRLSLLDRRDSGDRSKKTLLKYSFNKEQDIRLLEGESVAFVIHSSAPSYRQSEMKSDPIHKFMTTVGFERTKNKKTGVVTLSTKYEEGYTPPQFGSIISSDELKICDAPLRKSVLRKAEHLFQRDLDLNISLPHAFLNRLRLDEDCGDDSWRLLGEKNKQSERMAAFLASRDKSGVFVIQGPPGSGKTSLSATVVHRLITKHNKTVAVSSNSHAAIDNLLRSVVNLGLNYADLCKIGAKCIEDERIPFKGNLRDLRVVRVSERNSPSSTSPTSMRSSKRDSRLQGKSAALVGATCYQLCREDSEGLFDFLFVDEASQVPVSNFLAMSSCAKYAVLVGDQQQLEMPTKGAHPGESAKSCLAYIVGDGVTTVPPFRGLFLEYSYRMAPPLCSFVSKTFYNGALLSAPACENNKLLWSRTDENQTSSKAGIVYLSCDSEYENENGTPVMGKLHQPAEVRIITKLVHKLLGLEYTIHSENRELCSQDILVVAPYNIQVRALRQSLSPQIRVGTVDKFQGQQAPIVIISLCTGDPKHCVAEEESLFSWNMYTGQNRSDRRFPPMASRRTGLHFALQKNRLNVAISRAQCLSFVVGHSDPFANIPLNHIDDIALMGRFEQLREEGKQEEIYI
ncbi:unnamed protein product [Agarophyton chilense]|eukprot:gb/GEZJ01002559.1/.p1 GENE.gb/GEZJ01002559.1/~~gb/GEZJ01002559.1/.p1  ORF type:complete len:1326 (+),score=177.16 gb/GEZJ01002559.1/:423-4400(+)